ncbi:hypothetical protein [Arthrobacter sp. HS15c]|uniref:hypothetical protein n=1 Tax=Arthrobacter sp. HS15c TaxID=3230279 RepID=UPI003465F1F4
MGIVDRGVIGSCYELGSGDAVEAFHENRLVYRGPVTEVVPDHGRFWILDTLTGGRRLVDMSELEIVRIPSPVVEPWLRLFLRKSHRPAGVHYRPSGNWREVSALP